MFLHGLMKVMGGLDFMKMLGGMPPFVPDHAVLQTVLGMVATAFELLGGLGVVLGYRFRTACVLVILVMLAAFTSHLQHIDGFRNLMLNAWSLEIACVFVALFLMGPGDRYCLGGKAKA